MERKQCSFEEDLANLQSISHSHQISSKNNVTHHEVPSDNRIGRNLSLLFLLLGRIWWASRVLRRGIWYLLRLLCALRWLGNQCLWLWTCKRIHLSELWLLTSQPVTKGLKRGHNMSCTKSIHSGVEGRSEDLIRSSKLGQDQKDTLIIRFWLSSNL